MKYIFATFLFFAAFLLFFSSDSYAQCVIDSTQQNKIMKNLSKNGYRLSKSFRVQRTCRGCNSFTNYTVIMMRGNTYTLVVLSNKGGAKNIIANLKELSGKVIVSNYDNLSGKYYTTITFQCNRTTPYYLNFVPRDSKESCGMAYLAFKTTR